MKPKCLETRLLPNGLKMRRYRNEDGSHYRTVEAPIEVWSGINKQGRGNDRMAGWLRAREQETQRTKARALAAKGWKAVAIAHELQMPVRTVHRWLHQPAQHKEQLVQQDNLHAHAVHLVTKENWKPLAVAHALQIAERTVYRWVQRG